ncbi:MAG: NADH-quinone oxidoreductase subunit NuoE [Betaproteobacteria bacterium]|nr:NADH-quinone oxidoreductase subunit NuoE [Betaproteobacteria bacterium]
MSTAELDAGLTADDVSAVQAFARRYQHKRAACIEALMAVQRRHRWISDQKLREVAALLDMTPDELDGVATFYNLLFRRPVGRHVIMVCDSVSCWLMGHDALLAALQQRLGVQRGQTTADDRFTLLPIVCLGHCDHAPAMLIDDDLHGDVEPEKLDAVLAAYR